MNAIHKTEVIGDSILSLEQALERFIKHIEQPKPIPERGRVLFRYEHPSALIFLTLKAVRVVSGLNAAVYLLKRGFIQELGVVIRTILEFLHNMEFIQDGQDNGSFSEAQQEMIDSFFTYDLRTTEDIISTTKKQATVSRKKVHATIARQLFPENPYKETRGSDHDILLGAWELSRFWVSK